MAKKKTEESAGGPGSLETRIYKLSEVLTPEEIKQANRIIDEADFKVLKLAYYIAANKDENQKQVVGPRVTPRQIQDLKDAGLTGAAFDKACANILAKKIAKKKA